MNLFLKILFLISISNSFLFAPILSQDSDDEAKLRQEARELRKKEAEEKKAKEKQEKEAREKMLKEETPEQRSERIAREKEEKENLEKEKKQAKIREQAKAKEEAARVKREAEALLAQEKANKEEAARLKKETAAKKEAEKKQQKEEQKNSKEKAAKAKATSEKENKTEVATEEKRVVQDDLKEDQKKEIESFFISQRERNEKRKDFGEAYGNKVNDVNNDYQNQLADLNKKLAAANEKKTLPDTDQKSADKAIEKIQLQIQEIEVQKERKLERLKETESAKAQKLELQLIKEEQADLRRLASRGIKDPRSSGEIASSLQQFRGDLDIKLADVAAVDLESYPTFVNIFGSVTIQKKQPKPITITSERKSKIDFFDKIKVGEDGYCIIHILNGITVAADVDTEIIFFPSFQINDMHVAHVFVASGRVNAIVKNANKKLRILVETTSGRFLSDGAASNIVIDCYNKNESLVSVIDGKIEQVDESNDPLKEVAKGNTIKINSESAEVIAFSNDAQGYAERVYKDHSETKEKADELGKEALDAQEEPLLQTVKYEYPQSKLLEHKEAMKETYEEQKKIAFLESQKEYNHLIKNIEKQKTKLEKKAVSQDKKAEQKAIKEVAAEEERKKKEAEKAEKAEKKRQEELAKEEKKDAKAEEKRKAELENIKIKTVETDESKLAEKQAKEDAKKAKELEEKEKKLQKEAQKQGTTGC